jgi:hypothetical protein
MIDKLLSVLIRKKKLVFIGSVFILLIAFLSSKTILIVSVEGQATNAPIQLIDNQEPTTESGLKHGLNMLSPGQYTIKAHSEHSETRLNVIAKAFKINRATVKMKPQQAAQKVAREAGDCPIGNPEQMKTGDVFSYICTNPLHIFKNSFNDVPKKEVLIENANMLNPTPHLDGVVHFLAGADDVGTILEFINQGGKRTITRYDANFSSGHYIVKSKNEKLYVLDSSKKQLEIYSGPSFSKQTVSLEIDSEEWNADSISFDAHNNTLFVLSALVDEDNDGQEPTYSRGILWTFDLSSISERENPNKTYAINRELIDSLTNFISIDNSTLASRSHNDTAIIYKLGEDDIKGTNSFPAASGLATVNEVLYVLIAGNIYTYVPADNSLYLSFDSKKITVSGLRPLNNQLLFNGFSENETNPENQTYILNRESIASNNRIEDFLPYGDLELPDRWMDYKGKKIYVKLLLNSIGFQRDGQVLFDQNEFETNRKAVLDQLAKDGYSAPEYSLNFMY